MQNWINDTNWPPELQQFVVDHRQDPFTVQVRASKEIQQHINGLAKSHACAGYHDAMRSVLYLIVGDLDSSHSISQEIHSSVGSYLHGVMHRREGDFSNAKYWFHRADETEFLSQALNHLSAEDLQLLSDQVGRSQIDAFDLTDLHQIVSRSVRSGIEPVKLQEAVTNVAWQELRCVVDLLIYGRNASAS